MREKPKLQVTRNYDLFEKHEWNRREHNDPTLMSSMQTHGFMPSGAIHCVRNGIGKLKVIRGHHRLHLAERLGLPVWFIVDDSNVDLYSLEGGRQAWSAPDFLYSRATKGNDDCAQLMEFQKQHGLTLGAAASLLGGQSAGSWNKVREIKSGTFKVASDLSHAHAVVAITDDCRRFGIPFATSTAFVAAVSMCVRVPEFSVPTFRHRLRLHGNIMRQRSRNEDYLAEIEALYNYGSRGDRLALAFKAREVSRGRSVTFGRSKPNHA